MMHRQAATQIQENSALCANLLISQKPNCTVRRHIKQQKKASLRLAFFRASGLRPTHQGFALT
jgi:hypothetical protein